jgi:hypothetical protein
MRNNNYPNNEPEHPSPWETVEEDTELTNQDDEPSPILGDDNLSQAIRLGERVLELSTGHDPYQRRKIVLYAVATQYVEQTEQFPVLLVYGSPSTGKTQTLNFLKGTCYRVAELTAQTVSEAAFRARMNRSDNGTLVIEEADVMDKKDLDGLLNTRPMRATATFIKMVYVNGGWEERIYNTYGATIVHRRIPFENAALMRRIIVITTVSRKGDYIKFRRDHRLFTMIREKLVDLPALPPVENIWGIEPGIFDCYLPIVAVAVLINDQWFLSRLVSEMRLASQDLRMDESFLEYQTLLRGLIRVVYEKYGDKTSSRRMNIDVTEIAPAIIRIDGPESKAALLKAGQRNRILTRNFGFSVEPFGGANRVCFFQAQLIAVCDKHGVKDEVLEIWRAKLNEAQGTE